MIYEFKNENYYYYHDYNDDHHHRHHDGYWNLWTYRAHRSWESMEQRTVAGAHRGTSSLCLIFWTEQNWNRFENWCEKEHRLSHGGSKINQNWFPCFFFFFSFFRAQWCRCFGGSKWKLDIEFWFRNGINQNISIKSVLNENIYIIRHAFIFLYQCAASKLESERKKNLAKKIYNK